LLTKQYAILFKKFNVGVSVSIDGLKNIMIFIALIRKALALGKELSKELKKYKNIPNFFQERFL
jgi:hypothetical protein